MPIEQELRRLAAARYTTKEAMAAAGTPDARFQQRFKESRLPLSGIALDPAAKRRSYTLADIYMLRLLEVLAGPGRLDVKAAVEAVREVVAHDLAVSTRNLDGRSVPTDELSIFRDLLERPPELWDNAWKERDEANPCWVIAREYHFGWRSCTSRDVAHALRRLPQPEEAPAGGSFTVLLNLTEELARVDRVLGLALDIRGAAKGGSDA